MEVDNNNNSAFLWPRSFSNCFPGKELKKGCLVIKDSSRPTDLSHKSNIQMIVIKNPLIYHVQANTRLSERFQRNKSYILEIKLRKIDKNT